MINEVKTVNFSQGIHLSAPFYDTNLLKWISLSCTYFEPPTLFVKPLTLGGSIYNTSTIACVALDQSKYLDYKKTANTSRIVMNNTRLASIVNSYMFITDNQDLKLLYVPDSLSENYNYTSIYSPELIRFTAFSKASMKSDIANIKPISEDNFLNYSVKIAKDPSAPTFITDSQIHIRALNLTFKPSKNFSYVQNYLFYFGVGDLTASKTLINENVKAAQSQINYLALIVIIIICAVVMCISFRYVSLTQASRETVETHVKDRGDYQATHCA